MPSPRTKLLTTMASAWAPRERVSIADWAAREVRLPLAAGPNPRVDWRRYPMWKGVLDAAEDPETEEIYLPASTQIGKTTCLQLLLAGLAETRPAPAMLCAPDQDALRKLRDKFYGMCDATPVLRNKVPTPHKRNMSSIDFGNSVCHLAWSGNPQRVAAESCRVVLVTETDRAHRMVHEGAIHKLIGERVKGWFDSLKVFEGTPTDSDSVIIALYDASDKCKFKCPCPHCGHHQALRFFVHTDGEYKGCGGVDGMKDDEGEWLTADEVIETAFYRCEKGCRIENRDKDAMVRQGVWVPEGCTIGARWVQDGVMDGTPKRSRRKRGFGGLTSLYADTISIGAMAAEYLSSRDKPEEEQNFWNNWCAMRYMVRTKTPKGYELWQRLQHAHRRGTVPSKAIFLTAAVDVHDTDTHWVVRAWGEGCTSWLVDWGVCPAKYTEDGKTILGSQLEPIKGLVIEKSWPVAGVNPCGVTELLVLMTGVDSGYQPLMVHEFVRKYHSDKVRAIAGAATAMQGEPWKQVVLDRIQRTGKVYPGGLKRWTINTEHYKTDIQDRWNAPLDEPGAWFITDAPWEDASGYLRQVTNEGRRFARDKKGFPRQEWWIIQKGIGNHFFDCETYSRALADMVTGGKWEKLVNQFRVPPKRPKSSRDDEGGSFIRKPRSGGFIRR